MEVKTTKFGYRYFLIFIDSFHETAQMVVKKLMEDILPKYGFPTMIQSDNDPAFVSQLSQNLTTILGNDWKLHCEYRSYSSGQVDGVNRTLK